MTNNYSPITEPGTSRTRTKFVELHNQYGTNPLIRWYEQRQILMADGSYQYVDAGTLNSEITEEMLQADFPLVHPDNGVVYGSMKGYELFNGIISFYINEATKRDLAANQVTV